MESKCPSCKKKLSLLYTKETCPYCGCDLLNFEYEKRLLEDAKKAESEFEAANRLIEKLVPAFIKKRIKKD